MDLAIFAEGASRDLLLAFQKKVGEIPNQINPPLKHYFAPGLYAREIHMSAGDCVVGKIHKHAHVNNISKGRVLVTTEFGKSELVAPCQFVSEPGTKRAVLVLEDCIWTTYHPTDKTDLDDIEEEVIAKSFEDYDALKNPSLSYRVKKFLSGVFK